MVPWTLGMLPFFAVLPVYACPLVKSFARQECHTEPSEQTFNYTKAY